MKKFTLLFLLSGAVALAQQTQTYTDMVGTTPQNGTADGAQVTIVGAENPIIDTYTSLTDFNQGITDNCSDPTLTNEDFTGGPGAITTCGLVISSSDGGACFGVGDLEDGFDVQASNVTDVVFIPNGAIGNTTELVGANTFAEYTIINFDPAVYAVAMEIWANTDPNTDIRVFGTGGLIQALTITTTVGFHEFFGVIADEEITSIELEGQNGSGELFGVFAFGADCMQLGVNDNLLSQVSLFPNPATDKLNIQVPAGVELISAVMYDVLGKAINTNVVNGQINVASLNEGIYMLSIETSQGTVTRKVMKK